MAEEVAQVTEVANVAHDCNDDIVVPEEFEDKIGALQICLFLRFMLGKVEGDPILVVEIKKLSQQQDMAPQSSLFAAWIALLSSVDGLAFEAAKQPFLGQLLLFEQSEPILLRGLTHEVSGGSHGEEKQPL